MTDRSRQTLRSADEISSCRTVSPLGAGGMGEVCLKAHVAGSVHSDGKPANLNRDFR